MELSAFSCYARVLMQGISPLRFASEKVFFSTLTKTINWAILNSSEMTEKSILPKDVQRGAVW